MRLRCCSLAILLSCLASAAHANAGTFVGQAWMTFSVTNQGGGGVTDRMPVDFIVTTDYDTLDFRIDWELSPTTVAGGPDETFEVILEASGTSYSRDAVELGFPNTSGVVSGTNTTIKSDFEFSVTSRVVSFEETYDSGPVSSSLTTSTSQRLSIGGYPEAIHYEQTPTNFHWARVSQPDNSGNSILFEARVYESEVGNRGIDTSLVELIPGDFNDNGVVDAADYTVARDASTPVAGALTSDAVWRANYGRVSSDTAISVPEPGSLALAAVVSIAALVARCRATRGMP